MEFPVSQIRERFPSLARTDGGTARTYADNPAGTQIPATVVEAIGHYLLHHSSNAGGKFQTSIETERVWLQALGCDFLACSSYKFFGPHMGIVWGRESLLSTLYPYKGRCVSNNSPDRFEMGTPQYELLAGLSATVEYFSELGRFCGGSGSRRELIAHAYQASRDYEEPMTNRLIEGLQDISGITIYGITNPNLVGHRVPTVSFRHTTQKPDTIAAALARSGIHVWHGHNYAYEPARALGLPLDEGVVRIGLAHYNTNSEVEHILQKIEETVA